MNRETYLSLMDYWNAHEQMKAVVSAANKALTALVFLCYPTLLIWAYFQQRSSLAAAILVPGISFVLVSLLRYFINRKRPYEVFEVPSALGKETLGKSFPSRHVFSVFIIAMTWLFIFPWHAIGITLLVIGFLLGTVRVLGGVHYPSDCIAGALIGIAAGALGYFLFL